jgi:hypothetical protein
MCSIKLAWTYGYIHQLADMTFFFWKSRVHVTLSRLLPLSYYSQFCLDHSLEILAQSLSSIREFYFRTSCFFETESHSVAQSGLKLVRFPECWDYMHVHHAQLTSAS